MIETTSTEGEIKVIKPGVEGESSNLEELKSLKDMLDKEQIELGNYLKKLYKKSQSSFDQLKTELTNVINDEESEQEKGKWQELMKIFVKAESDGFKEKMGN